MASPPPGRAAGSPNFETWFDDALRAYRTETKKDLDLDTLKRTIKTPEDLLKHIESRGESFRNFRDKHSKLWTRMYAVLQPVAAIGSVTQTAVSSFEPFGPPASAVLGAVLYLVRAADGVKDAYDWIQILFGEFEVLAVCLQEYVSRTRDLNAALQDQIVATLTCMLQLFGRAEALIKLGRFKKYLKIAFLNKDERTKSLLDELTKRLKYVDRIRDTLMFTAATNAENYSKSAAESGSRNEDQVKALSLQVEQLKQQMRRDVSRDQIRDMKKMLETPAADKVARILSTQKRQLVDDTGLWLESEENFSTWRNGQICILWILGDPGSGKSFLATRTISNLQKHFSRAPNSHNKTAVAFFFVKENDDALLDPNNILKTLALQIADLDIAFANHIASYCMGRGATITEEETWDSLFVDFYSSAEAEGHYAILILDGLDEASSATRTKLLAIVKSVTDADKSNHLGGHIRFGIFGRPVLRDNIVSNAQEKLILVASKNQDDIGRFIQNRLPGISLVKREESRGPAGHKEALKLRNTITKEVLRGADGVFLWAELIIKEIENLNKAQVGKVLKDPPHSLYGMISDCFHRIARDGHIDSSETNRVMLLICFARRPLLYGELKLFLSLPKQRTDALLWHNLRGHFASLIKLKHPEWYDPDAMQDGGGSEVQKSGAGENNVSNEDETTETSPAADGCTHSGKHTTHSVNNIESDDNDDTPNDDSDDSDDSQNSDDDADYDFGSDDVVDSDSYDSRTAQVDNRDAQEHTNSKHKRGRDDTVVQLMHQQIKDFLIDERHRSNMSPISNDFQVDVHRAEIVMTITCLQALQQSFKQEADQARYIRYPARNFVLHLSKIEQEHLTAEDTREIIAGLVDLFYHDHISKAILIALGPLYDAGRPRAEFWDTWIGRQDHREVVQRWLRKAEVETIVTDEVVLKWVHRAQKSPVALLEPMMKGASQIWLTKTGYDDPAYADKSEWLVDVLRAFMSMDESGTVTNKDYQNWSSYRITYRFPASLNQVYEVAEWAGLEKTTHWYTGLAWILMNQGFYDEATVECDKAIKLDSRAWVSMECKARCLTIQQKYEEALLAMTSATENVPSSMAWIGSYLHAWISRLKQVLGDKQGAYEVAAKAFDTNIVDASAKRQLISTLCDLEDNSQTVIDVLAKMEKTPAPFSLSALVLFFVEGFDLYDEIGLACKKCGGPPFVLEAINQALDWCQEKTSVRQLVMMAIRTAHIEYHYYSHDNEAAELYESALRLMSEGSDGRADAHDLQDRIAVQNALSLILFDMAVTTKNVNQKYSRLSRRLKNLSIALDSSLDNYNFEFYGTDYPSLLWGRWLREHEGVDENMWRKPFRARLLDQIDMLDDDDPANDTYALVAVAKSLFHAGDRKRAGAILAIFFKLLEDHMEERDAQTTRGWATVQGEEAKGGPMETQEPTEEESEDAKDKTSETQQLEPLFEPYLGESFKIEVAKPSVFLGSPKSKHADIKATNGPTKPKAAGTELNLVVDKEVWMYTCFKCGRNAKVVSEMYICEVCDDKNWCDECLPLVKSGSLLRRDCNPKHLFYRAWPIPEEARNAAADWLEGEPRLRREWLEELRGQWL